MCNLYIFIYLIFREKIILKILKNMQKCSIEICLLSYIQFNFDGN